MSYARLLAILWLTSVVAPALQSDPSEAARDAMLAHRYAEAAGIYQRMVTAAPDQPDLRFNLALALHSLGRYRDAVRELEAIRTAERTNSKYWFLLGLGYLKLGHPRQASEPLENAVRLDPSSLDSRLELAGARLESGQLEDAERAFRQLSLDHQELPKIWEGLALSQFGLSRRAFELLEKTPHSDSLRYGLAAVAEAEAGNTSKAVDAYQRALAAEPQAPWMRAELAALQRTTGGKPEFVECAVEPLVCKFFRGQWQEVAESSARLNTPEALYWTSRAYSQLAQESLEKLSAMPPSPEQHQMLARAYMEQGHRSEAIAELRQAASLRPGDLLIRGQLAKALWTDRKYEDAVEILKPLVSANPEQPEWQFELGDALMSKGKPEEAAGHLQLAVSLAPDLLPAQAKLGELLLQTGNTAQAVAHLERAESLDKDGSLHYQLAVAYRRLGETDLASRAMARRKELQQASSNHPH